MRRRDCAAVITLECSQAELDFIDLMRSTTNTRPNIIRVALYSLADEMGLEPPLHVFDMHNEPKGRKRKANSRAQRRKKEPPQTVQSPADNHPWRGPLGKVTA